MNQGFELSMEKARFYNRASLDQIREAVSYAAVSIPEPGLEYVYGYQPEMISRAARSGFLVDAGHLPDAAVRTLGVRGADLAYEGAYGHPWGDRPWLLTHTWQGDDKTELATEARALAPDRNNDVTRHLYLVEPHPGPRFGLTVTEYLLLSVPEVSHLLLWPHPRCELLSTSTAARHETEVRGVKELIQPNTAASALNPVVSTMLLLNTRGILTEERAAPSQKNARLIRKKKPPIPGYTRILSGDYITAISMTPAERRRRSEASQGAKRRSPIPHLRRGHIRHYEDGHTVWIADQLIGTKDEGELSWAERRRAGYKLS